MLTNAEERLYDEIVGTDLVPTKDEKYQQFLAALSPPRRLWRKYMGWLWHSCGILVFEEGDAMHLHMIVLSVIIGIVWHLLFGVTWAGIGIGVGIFFVLLLVTALMMK